MLETSKATQGRGAACQGHARLARPPHRRLMSAIVPPAVAPPLPHTCRLSARNQIEEFGYTPEQLASEWRAPGRLLGTRAEAPRAPALFSGGMLALDTFKKEYTDTIEDPPLTAPFAVFPRDPRFPRELEVPLVAAIARPLQRHRCCAIWITLIAAMGQHEPYQLTFVLWCPLLLSI